MGANPAANSPTFQRNSKPYTKYACIFFIHRMCTAPGKLVTKKHALRQLLVMISIIQCLKYWKGAQKISMLRAREVKRSRGGLLVRLLRCAGRKPGRVIFPEKLLWGTQKLISLILMMMLMPRSVRRGRGERLLRLLKVSARCKPGRVSSGHLCPTAPQREHFN